MERLPRRMARGTGRRNAAGGRGYSADRRARLAPGSLAVGLRMAAGGDAPDEAVLVLPPRRRQPGQIPEVAHEPDLGVEPVPLLALDSLLDVPDEVADVAGRRAAGVDEDVGVALRHHRPADARALEPAPVDEPAGADALDLLEDAPGRGLGVEGRVALAAPLEVGRHHLAHPRLVPRLQLERGREQIGRAAGR